MSAEDQIVGETHEAANDAAPGLRERKKRATRVAIERALLELVLERGYDGATVEDVCARAEVSKKTFFNYYTSKDAALRGGLVTLPEADELVRAFEERRDHDYFDIFVHMIRRQAESDDPEVARLRDEVYRTYPQLAYRGQQDTSRIHNEVASMLGSYLEEHPDRRLLPQETLATEVTVAVSAAVCVTRIDLALSSCEGYPSSVKKARALLAAFVG